MGCEGQCIWDASEPSIRNIDLGPLIGVATDRTGRDDVFDSRTNTPHDQKQKPTG